MKIGRSIAVVLICHWALVSGQLRFNEFMTNPAGSENEDEFIELRNDGDADFSLDSLYFGDSSDMDLVISASGAAKLGGGKLAVILDPDHQTGYSSIIPDSIPLLTIEDSRFGAYGLSNTTVKTYYLSLTSGTVLDSITIPPQDENYSWERISPEDGTWGSSLIPGGTPGTANSLSPSILDPGLSGIELKSSPPLLMIRAEIRNYGLTAWQGGEYLIRVGPSPAAARSGEALNFSLSSYGPTEPDSTLFLEFSLEPAHRGYIFLASELVCPADENLMNNTRIDSLFILPSEPSLRINEFCPRPAEKVPSEYLELINLSGSTINLLGYGCGDAAETVLIDSPLILDADGTVLISPDGRFCSETGTALLYIDENMPSQNNTEDRIHILDPAGATVETFIYGSAWNIDDDMCQERINPRLRADDPENWKPVCCGSPGSINISIAPDYFLLHSSLHISMIKSDSLVMSFSSMNKGLNPVSNAAVTVFYDRNMNGITGNGEVMAAIILPGSLDIGSSILSELILPVSDRGNCIYILQDSFGGCVTDTFAVPFISGAFILNEIMPSPVPGQSEWIEIFNPGLDTVNLMGVTLSDPQKRTELSRQPLMLAPGGFILFSEDLQLLSNYPDVTEAAVIAAELPVLNTYRDRLMLAGPDGSIVDSMSYDESNCPPSGVSLEYLSSVGWLQSADSLGATPGRVNSQNSLRYSLILLRDISRDLSHQNRNASLQLVNSGHMTLRNMQVLMALGNSVFFDSSCADLSPGDTLRMSSEFPQSASAGWNPVTAVCRNGDIFFIDSLNIFRSYSRSPAALNEVLCIYSEENAVPESIELFCEDPMLDLESWTLCTETAVIDLPAGSGERYRVVSAGTGPPASWIQYAPLPSVPVLRNTGDILVLKDPAGRIMDSLDFREHPELLPGVSLEKNNEADRFCEQSAWGRNLGQSGHSLGKENSRQSSGSEISGLEFVPRHLKINENPGGMLCSIRSGTGFRNLELYILDILGRTLFSSHVTHFNGEECVIHWDGSSRTGDPPPPGLYLVLVRYTDLQGRERILRGSFTVHD